MVRLFNYDVKRSTKIDGMGPLNVPPRLNIDQQGRLSQSRQADRQIQSKFHTTLSEFSYLRSS